ncbi:hypothetical protein [Micromonospora mirobrigensis]|uniref:Beta-lactamase enzyme family protein n=1 Tax=Micromonospora mirobrigensis TaxID=262898 RepID=A0A1C4VEL2_9ACTN|nr:hypothetical protein [Micromonospora mirobrigensis]SCE82460.1 hypothetical protein GA0070564_1011158 [Micromonospora mirobrigensis]
MRSRMALVLAAVTLLLGGVALAPTAYARLVGDDLVAGNGAAERVVVPENTVTGPATLADRPVSVNFDGEFFSWALLDRATGEISGAPNLTSTSSTESMIKVWIVSDYLRQLGDQQPPADMRENVVTAIRDSNDDAANALYKAAGGAADIDRMITMCGLTDTHPGTVPGYLGWWSFTQMSPRDAARLGDCVADGTAAGPTWTGLVLDEMSKVRGTVEEQQKRSGGGRWGIIDGLPSSITDQTRVSIKNGWTPLQYDGNWHVNCLAVTDKWSLAVMMRYPTENGLTYGAKVCASVATQLVTPQQPGTAAKAPQQPAGTL